jgi:serine/threonine protein kinase
LNTNRETQKKIAVKHVWPSKRDVLINEVQILIKLHHPCVIRILGWSDVQNSIGHEIHMEFAKNGSLAARLADVSHDPGTIPRVIRNSTEQGKLICQIVLGMRYVHSQGVIHRDLKPDNILLDVNWRSKISDFGLSCLESAGDPATGEIGTVEYAPPEQIVSGRTHTKKSDVFSFGHILYELFTRNPVFTRSDAPNSILERIESGRLPTLPNRAGDYMQGLLRRCWSADPLNRPSFDAIFREFENCGFAILSGVDTQEIRIAVAEILGFEAGWGQKT